MTDVPNVRSFSLNSREAYEALTPPPDPWGWGPRLFRDNRWGRRDDPVCVWSEDEAGAQAAFQDWQRRAETHSG